MAHSEHISLRFTPKMPKQSRFSAVIAKKVASGSPDRHTWKRRIYEIVETLEKQGSFPVGAYVFFAKKDAHKRSYKVLMEEVKDLLRQTAKR